MKKVKIGKITFQVYEEQDGLSFYPNSKDDSIKMLRMGANPVVDMIMAELNLKFGRNRFFYRNSGKSIDEGMKFKLNASKLLDQL